MDSKNNIIKKRTMVTLVVAITVVALLVVCTFFMIGNYQKEREKCYYIIQNEIEDIITTVDCVMARTYTLVAMTKGHDGDTGFFDNVCVDIYNSVKDETNVSLKNISLAPGGKVEKVYPLKGNESFIGFDFMDASKPGNKEAIEAYESGKTILTNPFDLVQGGKGIAGRAPVMLKDENGNDYLWGIVSVTIDYDNMLEVLNLEHMTALGYDYELSSLDSDGNSNLMQKGGDVSYNPVSSDFNVRNLQWRFAIKPQGGWVKAFDVILALAVVAIIGLLSGLLTNSFMKVRETNEKLKYLSYRDGLTGVYSRHYVNTVLVNLQDGTWNGEGVKYSLMIIDIDDFKQFNDNFGHDVGDRVIYMVSKVLADNVKEHCGDCVIRFGGDEFVVLLNDVTRQRLNNIADSILTGIRAIHFDDIPNLRVSISGGVAFYDDCDNKGYTNLTKVADNKLYIAKEKGKNRIEV